MARTHTFKSSRDGGSGFGYFGFIEDGELVLVENWPREGGETYRGSFANATRALRNLEKEAPRLYNSIMKYYTENPETNEKSLSLLKPGDKFIRLSDNDPDFKDDTTYMLIYMEVSKCFVSGDKLSGFATALSLADFKVYIFDKTTNVKLIHKD